MLSRTLDRPEALREFVAPLEGSVVEIVLGIRSQVPSVEPPSPVDALWVGDYL